MPVYKSNLPIASRKYADALLFIADGWSQLKGAENRTAGFYEERWNITAGNIGEF